MAELVGFAKCPCCGFEKAGVFSNKRKKLVLNCRKKEGGAGCSTFLYQSHSAQKALRDMTVFISENPAPPVVEPENVMPVIEPEKEAVVLDIEPEKKPEKKPFSLFKGRSS